MNNKNINPWGFSTSVDESIREYVHSNSCFSYYPAVDPYADPRVRYKAKSSKPRSRANDRVADYEPSSAILKLLAARWV